MRLLLPSIFVVVLVSFLHLAFFLSSNADTNPIKILCREEEKEALLDFKLSFVADPLGSLSSWTIHNDDCCNWDGVSCDNHSQSVVTLDFGEGLKSYQLRPSLLALHHLTYLGLNQNQFAMRIPNFLGSLSKLTDLDLSESGFYGEIPPHLGNLSQLKYLHLGPSNHLWANTLQWLSPLSFISYLDLSDVNMRNAIDWASTLKMLPSLIRFTCTSCSLPSLPISSTTHVNSTSLQSLDLSNTSVSLSTFSSLINGSNNLQRVGLSYMQLEHYTLHGIIEVLASRARDSLEELSLVGNNLNKLPIEGVMFPSLLRLDVSFNRIGSIFPRILQYLPTNLTDLDFSSNFLNGVITDVHLSKFTHLQRLKLTNNNLLVFNFSKTWVPPFQLYNLELSSCIVGPTFPNWILTQKMLDQLDISNSMISGVVPDAFWDYSIRLFCVNVSHNKITCKIPNLRRSYVDDATTLDLSYNDFYGPIPLFLFTSSSLDLSHNRFSNFSPFHHRLLSRTPSQINLSSNRLSGSLPNWLFQFVNPLELNLANNMLSGTLPEEIGSLFLLFVLHLSNNNFSGQLPSSMKNCTYLNVLELANNNFSGSMPFWIGESMPHLIVLTLRSNNFFGDFPSTLCRLQSLQILDLSDNQISGSIPGCIHNLTAMSTNKGLSLMGTGADELAYSYENGFLIYLDYASVMWKGEMADLYSRSLNQRSAINLSGNMLRGEIPIEVTTLKGLRSLDLSRNGLSGSIPDKIGQMKLLELLNLSSNRLSGEIPKSLADITFLGTLNLSNNNLSGRIPSSTQLRDFDASSYAGNPELCGEPLSINCPGDEDDDTKQPLYKSKKGDTEESFDMQAFLAALGAGFAFGLFGVVGMLHYNRQFRLAFFHTVDNTVEKIMVTISLYHSRIKRSLCFTKAIGASVREG